MDKALVQKLNFFTNKKCILFDVDGVVINSEMFSVQYQKQFGVSNDEMLPFFKGVFQDCLVGKADLKKAIQPYLKKWNWDGSVEDFLLFWFRAEDNVDQQIIDLIIKLRENSVFSYIATNQEKYRTQYMRSEMGLENIFNGIFSSAEIGSKKPDKEFYEFILQELGKKGITKEEIFYIDDTATNVDSAKALGVDSYLYTNFKEFSNFIKS